jgi:hypothetical protein
MSKFQFTPDQIENLKSWKENLNTQQARDWAAQEAEAELHTSKILNSPEFKAGKDLTSDELDDLFSWMKTFSANRNLKPTLQEE